jgi:hypothetical protein
MDKTHQETKQEAHYTGEQMVVLQDFFTEEEIARRIEQQLPYPFE